MVTIKCLNGPIVVGYKFMQIGEQREVTEATAAEAKAQYGDAVWLPGEPEPLAGFDTGLAGGDVTRQANVTFDDEGQVSGVMVLSGESGQPEYAPEVIKLETEEAQDGDSLRNAEEPAAKRSSRTQRNAKR